MTQQELRLECIKAAVATQGEPDKVRTARKYYEFVSEVDGARESAIIPMPSRKK